jgi:hypothetical protein
MELARAINRQRCLTAALLGGAGLGTFLLVAQRLGGSGAGMLGGGHCVPTLLCMLVCYGLPAGAVALFAVATWRAVRSIKRQCAQTSGALQPLLALPAVAVPDDLPALLGSLQVGNRTRIIRCDVPVALCYGLVRPRILLSTGILEQVSHAELEAIVCHERAHVRRHDPLRLMLTRALADALPAHAAIRTLATALPLTQELAADRAVLAAVGAEALATALLKIGDALGPLQGHSAAIGGFSTLDARIDQLLGDAPAPMPSSYKAVMTVLATLILSPLLCTVGLLAWYVTLGPSLLWHLRERRGREYAALR